MDRVADTSNAGTGPGSVPRLLPSWHQSIKGEARVVNGRTTRCALSGEFLTGIEYRKLQKMLDALPDAHGAEECQKLPGFVLADIPGVT